MKTLPFLYLLVSWSSLALAEKPVPNDDTKLSRLRTHIDSLQLEEPDSFKSERTPFCKQLLSSIRTGQLSIIRPTAEAELYDDKKLSAYRGKCPSLELRAWETPPPSVLYRATKDFRIFELPGDFGTLKKDRYFIFFAEGYFSPEEKERFKGNPKIYPSAGYAYSSGFGGGGLYSVIDTNTCEFGTQLVVRGRYNFRGRMLTKHINQLFSYRDHLYVYDFRLDDDGEKNYGGLVVWRMTGPESVQQMCVYESLDSREQLRKQLEKAPK